MARSASDDAISRKTSYLTRWPRSLRSLAMTDYGFMQWSFRRDMAFILCLLLSLLIGCSSFNSDCQRLQKRTETEINTAIQCYQNIIEKEPKNLEAYLGLADLEINSQQYEKAEETLRLALILDKENKAKKLLARLYIKTNRIQNAQEIYDQILKENPTDLDALNGLAVVYSFQRNYDQALQYCKKVLEINPNNKKAQHNMGLAFTFSGQYDKAIATLKDLYEKSPHQETAFNLAFAYLLKGDEEPARSLLHLYLQPKEVESSIQYVKTLKEEKVQNSQDTLFSFEERNPEE